MPQLRPQLRTPSTRVLLLVLGMCLASVLLWTVSPMSPLTRVEPAAWALTLPWWVLVLLFVAAELFVFHLQYRREAKSVSASEIPLVLGLQLAAPGVLLASRLLGGLLVFVVHRRQTPLKVGFNLALLLLDTTVAVMVFDLVADGARPLLDARGWGASVAAAVAAAALDALLLSRVISWYDKEYDVRRAAGDVWFSARMAALVATVGVIPVLALAMGRSAILPLLAAGAVLATGFRAYAGLADRHTSLSRLFHFSEAVNVAPSAEAVLSSVLQESRELLRAETAMLFRPAPEGGFDLWVLDGDAAEAVESSVPAERAAAAVQVMETGRPIVIRLDETVFSEVLDEHGHSEAVLAPLRTEGEVSAVLAVLDRLGEVRGFEAEDTRLLETVANHAAVALQNGHLIARLRHDAMHDELTGLPNRAMFYDLAQQAAQRSAAGGPAVAVMIMDLDGFKSVNDTLGHQVGDQMLIALAGRLAAAAGEASAVDEVVVARLGGDEFAVLATGVRTPDDALRTARRLLSVMDQPVTVNRAKLSLAGSLGIALGPRDGESASALLRCADVAMYAAKQATGGARLFDTTLDSGDPLTLPLAADLRESIVLGQVYIEVQPIMAVASGEVTAVEALARWQHPELGRLTPSDFLGPAERGGLMGLLTESVLDQALKASRVWAGQGSEIRVSVNIPARALSDPGLPQMVSAALQRAGVPASRLVLEITENSVVADPDRAIAILDQLRAVGVRLSVDDFGTGYSSLTYLSRLPINQLKIDKSFIAHLHSDRRDEAIVQSIIDLAGNLELEVVAEGVEDPATLRRLEELGCGLVQGFHVARPMAPERLQPWLASHAPLQQRRPSTVG